MEFRPCPRCGKLVPDEASFCRRCGNGLRVGAVRARRPAPPPPPASGRPSGVYFASAAAVMGAIMSMIAVSRPCRLFRCQYSATHFKSPPFAAPAPNYGEELPADPQPSIVDRPEPRAEPAPAAARIVTGPRIEALSDARVRAGKVVVISGSGFDHASRVLFIGRRTAARASAAFVVRDDSHLAAVVPPMGSGPQELAVAVVTPHGVAVTVPPDATPVDAAVEQEGPGGVMVVQPAGVFHGADAAVVVVGPGGFAGAAAGRTIFARRGSRLWGRAAAGSLVFCERGVLDDSNVFATREVVEVDAINPCTVDALPQYVAR